jgi:hypothetical protein
MQGLPSCNQTSGGFGSFTVSAEYCTPEGKEKLIMSGSYGPWLKICRESIDLYTKSKALYDICVVEQNKRYEEIAQIKLNALKQQLDNERQRLEIEKIEEASKKLTCPTNSYLDTNGNCVCNSGYYYDLSSKLCLIKKQIEEGRITTVSSQSFYMKLEKAMVEEEKKLIEDKAIKIDQNKNVSSTKKTEVVDDINITSNTADLDILKDQIKEEKQNISNEHSEKVNIFQKAGKKTDDMINGMAEFFKKMFIKIKFW